MILTIDVGNTNITCGVFQGDEIAASFRITTKMPRTSDEYGMMLLNLLEQNDIHPTEIKDAIICSVVPNVMHSLRGGLVKYFHITPIVVEAGIKTGIRIVTPNPQQIGADRIVDAVGAYEIYGGPVLVIDFGTATTYDYVDESGAFQGRDHSTRNPDFGKSLVGRCCKTSGDRDQKASINSRKRHDHKYAGRACVRTDRTDRIHHQPRESGSRTRKYQNRCNRRTWPHHCQ